MTLQQQLFKIQQQLLNHKYNSKYYELIRKAREIKLKIEKLNKNQIIWR